MRKVSKVLCLLLVLVMLFAACGPKANNTANNVVEVVYEREDDAAVYEKVLTGYEDLMAAAKAAPNDDARFVLYAQAEAALLDSATFLPTTTKGGAYTISRIAYRTVPYVNWGNDEDRWKGIIISDEFISKEERADLINQWNAAVKGEAKYDPAAYLQSKGHKIITDYKTTFTTPPATLDTLNTSMQSDTEILVNTTDNLVQYNNLGQMIPACAESFDVSTDGKVYTFHIRQGAYWSDSLGNKVAEVTAEDFEAGFHHMLDAQAGLEWLVQGVVKGADEYLTKGGSWADVGYKATDKYTLTVTLEDNFTYFPTMLTYSCFSPICKSFYESHGGVYGIAEYAEAVKDTTKYTYGLATDVSSQVYNGAFLLTKLNSDSEINLVKNPNYYDPESVKINSITWIHDSGEDPVATYNSVKDGTYAGMGLTESTGTLKLAKDDGLFDKYSYISDTDSTTYFGGLNVDRGTYALESGACASPKTEQQKIDTHNALLNKDFRKALLMAFDKKTWNAVSRGEDLALTNIRNMYTHPEFVQLSTDQTDKDGHKFPAGTMYGEMVQYYCDKLGAGIKVADQINGWYDVAAAKQHLAKAKEALGTTVNWPVTIDIVYYSPSNSQTAQAQACKKVIEDALGSDNVVINLVEATVDTDYYASGYRASNGEAGNFDLFYGSGWGPDFGDPCTYLDTFLGNGAGYMTKVIGLF